MTKNYLLFYALLILFITGGIKLTSYVLEKKRKDKFEHTDHHQLVTNLLAASGQIEHLDTKNKNIILYIWNEYSSRPEDFIRLNGLAAKYAGNSVFYAASLSDKEYAENYFQRKKIIPLFTSLYHARELDQYSQTIRSNFYDADSIRIMRPGLNTIIVINAAGKVKLYRSGPGKGLTAGIENAIKE